MKYVAALNFNSDRSYYIHLKGDGSWHESYTPIGAAEFNSMATAKNWVKNNTTMGDYVHAEPLDKAIESFNEWVKNGMIRRSFPVLNKSISRKYDKNKDTPLDVLNWRCEQNDDNVRYEDYKTWPRLYSIFDHLWDVSKYTDGKTFSIYVKPDSVFKKFKKEFDLVIDKVDKRNEKGELFFNIFDHFCGEGGNFAYLVQSEDGTWRVDSRWNTLSKGTLKECFEFMKKNRYYE